LDGKTHKDHRDPFGDGLFRLGGVMTGLHQQPSITLTSDLRVWETDRSAFQTQVDMHVIFMYATVDKMRGEIQETSRTKSGAHRIPKAFLAPSHEKKPTPSSRP